MISRAMDLFPLVFMHFIHRILDKKSALKKHRENRGGVYVEV